MKTATEMRKITNNYSDVQKTKRMKKNFKWMDKAIKTATKRAKRGYSWVEVKTTKWVDGYWAVEYLENKGYRVTVGAKYYRLSW